MARYFYMGIVNKHLVAIRLAVTAFGAGQKATQIQILDAWLSHDIIFACFVFT